MNIFNIYIYIYIYITKKTNVRNANISLFFIEVSVKESEMFLIDN